MVLTECDYAFGRSCKVNLKEKEKKKKKRKEKKNLPEDEWHSATQKRTVAGDIKKAVISTLKEEIAMSFVGWGIYGTLFTHRQISKESCKR